jgi:hypothetical protein
MRTEQEKDIIADAIDQITSDDDLAGDGGEMLRRVRDEYLYGDASRRLHHYERYDTGRAYQRFVGRIRGRHHLRIWRYVGAGAAAAAAILCVFMLPSSPWEGKYHSKMVYQQTGDSAGPALQRSSAVVRHTIPSYSNSVPQLILPSGRVLPLSQSNLQVDGFQIRMSQNSISVDEGRALDQTVQIFIPRGRQYQVTLSDGTNVWLNSETTLTFPTHFARNRSVAITGQAYFEVTHTGYPFSVTCSRGTVKVLGTSFDVCDYKGESTRITLVNGSITYATPSSTCQLHPGEQVSQSDASAEPTITSVDPRRFMAWKDGLICFQDELLEDVMHRIERIYNVNIHYKDPALRQLMFTGECSRYHHVEDFLKLLSLTEDFGYEIHGNDITLKIKQPE